MKTRDAKKGDNCDPIMTRPLQKKRLFPVQTYTNENKMFNKLLFIYFNTIPPPKKCGLYFLLGICSEDTLEKVEMDFEGYCVSSMDYFAFHSFSPLHKNNKKERIREKERERTW